MPLNWGIFIIGHSSISLLFIPAAFPFFLRDMLNYLRKTRIEHL